MIGDDQPCGGCATFSALTPADRYGCGDWTTAGGPAGSAISAGADLSNTGLPFALPNDDWCGAFQWTRTLAPGASDGFEIAIEMSTGGMAGTSANLGTAVGGAGGAPTLGAPAVPRLGRLFQLDVGNGGAATTATILIGIDAAPVQAPVFGLQVMTPASGIIATAAVPLARRSRLAVDPDQLCRRYRRCPAVRAGVRRRRDVPGRDSARALDRARRNGRRLTRPQVRGTDGDSVDAVDRGSGAWIALPNAARASDRQSAQRQSTSTPLLAVSTRLLPTKSSGKN